MFFMGSLTTAVIVNYLGLFGAVLRLLGVIETSYTERLFGMMWAVI